MNETRLKRLIEACHREGILVYAWFELPHVSERFWQDHPEWREKTASGKDGQVGWRFSMNLQNPAAYRAAIAAEPSFAEAHNNLAGLLVVIWFGSIFINAESIAGGMFPLIVMTIIALAFAAKIMCG